MNITMTDFGFDDLIALMVIIDLFVNFVTLLFYGVIKDLKEDKKGDNNNESY